MRKTRHLLFQSDKDGQEIQQRTMLQANFSPSSMMKKDIPDLQLTSSVAAAWDPGRFQCRDRKDPRSVLALLRDSCWYATRAEYDRPGLYGKSERRIPGGRWAFRSGFQSGIVRWPGERTGLSSPARPTGDGVPQEMIPKASSASYGITMSPLKCGRSSHAPDGFEIEFTNPSTRNTRKTYLPIPIESFITKYQGVYGSPL